jgi:N-acetylmuramoyl-L-alanine amidase
VEPSPIVECDALKPGDAGEAVAKLGEQLAEYGYGIEPGSKFDSALAAVVRAFQRHFRPQRVDGIADDSTIDTLQRLLDDLPSSR